MNHVVLLGDSIFDNGRYVPGEPDLVAQLQAILPDGDRATRLAVDGNVAYQVAAQLQNLPSDATHLVLSVGGNDALMRAHLIDTPVRSTAEALLMFGQASRGFETDYREAVTACLGAGLPLTICTIYNGNFADPSEKERARVALTVFNDVILRTAIEHRLSVLDLRLICNRPEDYANPIEPSAVGGAKIARAIQRHISTGPVGLNGAYMTGAV